MSAGKTRKPAAKIRVMQSPRERRAYPCRLTPTARSNHSRTHMSSSGTGARSRGPRTRRCRVSSRRATRTRMPPVAEASAPGRRPRTPRVAEVCAAVVAPEREVVRASFSWRWPFEEWLVERLVSEGRLERIEPGLVTAPASG